MREGGSEEWENVILSGSSDCVQCVRDTLVRDGILESHTSVCRTIKEEFRTTILKFEIVLNLSSVFTVARQVPRESLTFVHSYVDLKFKGNNFSLVWSCDQGRRFAIRDLEEDRRTCIKTQG